MACVFVGLFMLASTFDIAIPTVAIARAGIGFACTFFSVSHMWLMGDRDGTEFSILATLFCLVTCTVSCIFGQLYAAVLSVLCVALFFVVCLQFAYPPPSKKAK